MTRSNNNPLLGPLGEFRELPDWPSLLEHNPLEDFPERPSAAERHDFLVDINNRFAVTKVSIRLASDIQSLIRAGYRQRDPTHPENRRKLYKIADLEGTFDAAAPVFYSDSHCLVLSAITGMGKSLTVNRILSTFKQVAVHGINEDAGWLKHTQIVHLTVKMSDTGSRGSFIDGVLYAMDDLLGTDYFNANRRHRNVGSRSLKVAQLLALHSVGLLIIEEMQAENFLDSRFRKELNVFFLSVLSFGVPLLLVGNPRAFERLSEHKQTERRYYSYEPITLWPYESYSDPDWTNAIAPALWRYQVVDNAEEYSEEVAKVLWECSGGIPGYAKQLIVEVQRSVFRREIPALTVAALEHHFKKLESFKRFMPLIVGLTNKDPDLLSEGLDIPVEQFRQRWHSMSTEDSPQSAIDDRPGPIDAGEWSDFAKKTKQRVRSKATRKKNKRQRAKEMQSNLDDEDIRRRENLRSSLSETLEELRAKSEKSSHKSQSEPAEGQSRARNRKKE